MFLKTAIILGFTNEFYLFLCSGLVYTLGGAANGACTSLRQPTYLPTCTVCNALWVRLYCTFASKIVLTSSVVLTVEKQNFLLIPGREVSTCQGLYSRNPSPKSFLIDSTKISSFFIFKAKCLFLNTSFSKFFSCLRHYAFLCQSFDVPAYKSSDVCISLSVFICLSVCLSLCPLTCLCPFSGCFFYTSMYPTVFPIFFVSLSLYQTFAILYIWSAKRRARQQNDGWRSLGVGVEG